MTSPTLLFPGLGASRLLSNNYLIYPPPVNHYFFSNADWNDKMMKDKSLKTLELGNKESIDLSISSLLSHRNIYAKLVRHPHLHPMPYDFRRVDDQEYVYDLCNDIRRYIENLNKPVTFLCHSTGGLLAHWFLHQQSLKWRRQWVRRVIYMNVPFGGTVSLLLNCVSDNEPINRFITKDLIQSLGATVWNMPNTKYLKHSVLIKDGSYIEDYMSALNLYDIQQRWIQNKNVIESFGSWTEVNTEIRYSYTMKDNTVNYYTLSDDNDKIQLEPVLGLGDGVVSEPSLLVPRQWGNISSVKFTHLSDKSHSSILDSVYLNDIDHHNP
jgi:pimeloyl-ACP methyl ester carboxylesterase